MFSFWLFTHFIGFAIWGGALIAVTCILFMMKRHLGSVELSTIVKKITRIVNILVHPSAFLVLVSGIFMIISFNFGDAGKPFYMEFMERVGGVAVLFTVIGISLVGRRLVKNLKSLEKEGRVIQPVSSMNAYIVMNLISILLIVSVIFVVSFRF